MISRIISLMVMVYPTQDAHVEETRAELNSFDKDLGKKAHFQAISKHLSSTLVFWQVPQDETDPLKKLARQKGQKISKKLSSLLRHNFPMGTYLNTDGTLDITSIQSNLGFLKDEILLTTHPAYGHKGDIKLMKRHCIIVEYIYPEKLRET